MRRDFHLHLYVPPEDEKPATGRIVYSTCPVGSTGGAPPVVNTPAPNLWNEVLKADTAQATPIRSLLSLTRAGLVRAVVSKSAVPVSDDQVASVIDELLDGRPFLAWLVAQLRDGGLEKLVSLILDLLKLAA